MPFGFHLTMDTLPSRAPVTLAPPWPARHYPRVRIRSPLPEDLRDLNPPGMDAARRTL